MNNLKMGKFIRELREEKGLTQDELANIVKVDRTFISRWERGVTLPDIFYIKELAKIFNVTIEKLVDGKRINNKENIDDKIKNAVNYYEKRNIKRLLISVIFLILLVGTIFVTIHIVNKYNYFTIDKLNISKDEFDVSGFFISNNEESYLLINDIFYDDIYTGTVDEVKVTEITIVLQNEKDLLTKKTLEVMDEDTNELSKVLSQFEVEYESEHKRLDRSTLLLNISYKTVNGISKAVNISLNE